MKNQFFTSALLCLSVCYFTSCTNNNEPALENRYESLSINAYIGSASTRAEKADWVEGDILGVFVCNGTIDKPYLGNSDRYNNVAFRHNGKGFSAQNIYLDESPAEVFAYYPHNVSNADGTLVQVESNTQTDYLYGKAATAASISKKNVNIEMKHALSQVVFKLRKGATYDEGPGLLESLKIENNDDKNVFQTSGTLNLGSGQVTGTSTNGVLTLMPGSTLLLTEEYQSISSICLPVSATAGKNIKALFTIDGRAFRYEFPASTTWRAGMRNIYTLTISNSGLEIGGGEGSDSGITIEPWEASTDNDISLVPIL
ncbi:MAG: fimbrillin family protein [Bacteroidetes bacterium]|nr:fimbrillin family protein [Bacteroidota bacterium]